MTAAPDPLATPLPGGMVLLGPLGVLLLFRALVSAERAATRDGISAPRDVATLRGVLAGVYDIARSSASGRSEVPPPAALATSAEPSSVQVDPIGTTEAASLLGCSSRNTRDLCRRGVFASARCRSGVWSIERDEVLARLSCAGTGRRLTQRGTGSGNGPVRGAARR